MAGVIDDMARGPEAEAARAASGGGDAGRAPPPTAGSWRFAAGLLLLAAGLVYLTGLGATPLFDGDEPRYAQACREMLARRDWLTPTFNGELRFQKPILIYWLILAAYSAFGISEFSARLASALAAVALAAVALRFLTRHIGRGPALFAAATLALNPQAMILGRASTPDALLCLFTTLCLLAFYEGYTGEDAPARRGYFLFWMFGALALLTKGPVGIGMPVLIALLFALTEGRLRAMVRQCRPLLGLLVVLGIAGPWYAAMILQHGARFTSFFFGKEHLGRFTQAMEGHSGPPYYYLLVLPLLYFPWSGLLPAAAVRIAQTFRRGKNLEADPAARLGRFALLWAGVVVTLFSFSSTKLPHYVYPAYPALAILAALCWRSLAEGKLSRRERLGSLLPVAGLLAALAAVAGLAPALASRLHFLPGLGASALAVGLAAAGLGAFGLRALHRGRALPSIAGLGLAALLLNGYLALAVAPPANDRLFGGIVRLSRRASTLGPDAAYHLWRIESSAAVYYWGRPGVAQRARGERLLREWARRPTPTLLLVRSKNLDQIRSRVEHLATDGEFTLVRVKRAPPPGARPAGAAARPPVAAEN
jgi:4-amino-4-deoxy-L-arabinose transferase-like glycosyltransferase